MEKGREKGVADNRSAFDEVHFISRVFDMNGTLVAAAAAAGWLMPSASGRGHRILFLSQSRYNPIKDQR